MTCARHVVSVIALSAVLAVAACAKKPPAQAPAPPPPPPPLTEEEIFARKTLEQLNAEKPLDDVFFDLDRSDLREDGKSSLQKDADWLKRWTSTQISVEGHCDSRGSGEDKLSLGSRRANAVKE